MTKILTINGGSTSLKFALFDSDISESRLVSGEVSAIGEPMSHLTIEASGLDSTDTKVSCADHGQAVSIVLGWLGDHGRYGRPDGVGHRVVHGGPDYSEPTLITDEVLQRLESIVGLAPDHLPVELAAIRAIRLDYGDVPQVAVFDTGFHRTISTESKNMPLPEVLASPEVRRYGFHGISCEYIIGELHHHEGVDPSGRVIIAHLGGGASITAVHGGKSVDTTMGMTPLGGLMMATRPGDFDPGVLIYLLRHSGITVDRLDELLNHRSGLLGMSGVSADMKTLLDRSPSDARASMAVSSFVFHAKKHLAAVASTLGGADVLVFTGGIGENSAELRQRICAGLDFMGVELDDDANRDGGPVISAPDAKVTVLVLRTDEERMIARHTRLHLGAEPVQAL